MVLPVLGASVLQFKKSQGERYRELPWGFSLDGDGVSLVQDPEEVATLRYIADLREEGLSFRVIAERLNSEGSRTKTGRSWAWHTVRMAYASLENVGKLPQPSGTSYHAATQYRRAKPGAEEGAKEAV